MKKEVFLSLLLVTFSGVVFSASRGDHVPSIYDLKWSALNFFILFGFLIWKLKKPVSEIFSKKASEVKEYFDHAEEKDKEAQIKYNMYKDKLGSLDSQFKKINSDIENKIEKFKRDCSLQTKENILRLKKETSERLNYEKSRLVEEINTALVNEVVSKAKEDLKKSSKERNRVMENILSNL